MLLLIHIVSLLVVAEGLRTRGQAANPEAGKRDSINEVYSFNQFMRDFRRTYEHGSEEYTRRAAIFQSSLLQIHAMNSRMERSWTAGVYPFMDWTVAERMQRLHGYALAGSHRLAAAKPLVALQTDVQAEAIEQVYGGADDSFEAVAPSVHNQGGLCGSCWAFAAVEAVEAQLMRSSSMWPRQQLGEPRLSVQSVLDCVSNPRHCGGTGGCEGATPELAFDMMTDIGIPLDTDLPYKPLQTGVCPMRSYPEDWMRVRLAGWHALPSNRAQPLMHTLVKHGPVVVAADSHKWWPYSSGIFDGCPQDAIPDHSVLAKGYGVDGGKKYWLIQNSWGASWGEEGSIRILRHDDEDRWCGTDTKPEEGFLCEGEAHRNVTVCGTCGLLFDPIIPQVGRVTLGQATYSGSAASTDADSSPESEDASSIASETGSYQADNVPAAPEAAMPAVSSAQATAVSETSADALQAVDIPDASALSHQVESVPSFGSADGGEEARQLDQAAGRVRAGEQQLAGQLQRVPAGAEDEESDLAKLDKETLEAPRPWNEASLSSYLSPDAEGAPLAGTHEETPIASSVPSSSLAAMRSHSSLRVNKDTDPMDTYLSDSS